MDNLRLTAEEIKAISDKFDAECSKPIETILEQYHIYLSDVETRSPSQSRGISITEVITKLLSLFTAQVQQAVNHKENEWMIGVRRALKIEAFAYNPKLGIQKCIEDFLKITLEHARKEAVEQERKQKLALWDEVVCPLCYIVNPQHATQDNGKGCHWCKGKEDWTGQALQEGK